MKTVTLEVRSPKEAMAEFAQTWKTKRRQKSARIGFASPELIWKVLTEKRWKLLKALCGAGPVSIREAPRRVHRDVKGVHGDVSALLAAGLLNRTEDGAIEFPYEAVKVEFLLQGISADGAKRLVEGGLAACRITEVPLGLERVRP